MVELKIIYCGIVVLSLPILFFVFVKCRSAVQQKVRSLDQQDQRQLQFIRNVIIYFGVGAVLNKSRIIRIICKMIYCTAFMTAPQVFFFERRIPHYLTPKRHISPESELKIKSIVIRNFRSEILFVLIMVIISLAMNMLVVLPWALLGCFKLFFNKTANLIIVLEITIVLSSEVIKKGRMVKTQRIADLQVYNDRINLVKIKMIDLKATQIIQPLNIQALVEVYLPHLKQLNTASFGDCIMLRKCSVGCEDIPAMCFQNCTKLAEFDFSRVKTIQLSAFYNCKSLKKVVSQSIKFIGTNAFYNCKSLDLVWLKSCGQIQEAVFGCCNIKKIMINGFDFPSVYNLLCVKPDSTTHIYKSIKTKKYTYFILVRDEYPCLPLLPIPHTFYEKDKVVYCPSTNQQQYFFSDWQIQTLISNQSKLTSKITQNMSNLKFMSFKNLTRIGRMACGGFPFLTHFHAKLTYVGESAFANCHQLSTINLGRVKTIGKTAFANCCKLKNQQLLQTEEISEKAFENCFCLDFVEAFLLKRCELDAFLCCGCQLKTGFKGDLIDVELVHEIDKEQFKYLKDFEFLAKDAKNCLIRKIKMNKLGLKRLKWLKAVVEEKKMLSKEVFDYE